MTEDEYIRITRLDNLQSCRDYMKLMTDFYFATGEKPVSSVSLNDARTWLQMMFSKEVHFIKALDGFEYSKGLCHLNRITDHTILFSLVHDMYESYVVFRLIYTLPRNEQQKDLMNYLFSHAGLQERFDNASEEAKKQSRFDNRPATPNGSLQGEHSFK